MCPAAAGHESRKDLAILRIGPVCLFRKETVLGETVQWLERHGYVIHVFDAARWASEADLHESFRRELAFPDYYGRNLDALVDCLRDLEFPSSGGIALEFRHYDAFRQAFPSLAQTVLDILASVSYEQLADGRKLLALVQSDDPAIQFDPVGARPVLWNERELFKRWGRL
ncbi:MAG: barstar family protein, partial [Methanobacteriota archaeon]